MRLQLPKLLVLSSLALSGMLISCDQDLTSSADQPLVDYVLILTDSVTAAPLEDVKIRVRTINGDTSSYYSDREEGRAELATVASSRTLFVFSKPGYRTLDLLDTVSGVRDTVFNRPVQRLLRVKMASLDPGQGRIQAQLQLRDEELQRLRRGRATFTDSLGAERVVSDHDSDGTLDLAGLETGSTLIKVEHPSRLGRWVEVKVAAGDTARNAMATTVVLLGLENSITGQVYAKTASGSQALLDAKVEFHLKDSLAEPDEFRTYTLADAGQEGRFLLDNVPALDGELRFFKDRSSKEPVKVMALTKEEVMLQGSLPRVTLTIISDSLLPALISGPGKTLPGNDSVNAKDTLQFKFNQAVEEVKSLKVRLINESELLIDSSWNADMTLLKVWQKEADWLEGKKYEYDMVLVNAQGEVFAAPGGSAAGITGTFMVRVPTGGGDSTLLFPRDISFAYFNSGGFYQFGPADSNTSPKADSTSQFARLKWKWDAGNGRHVDSLMVYYKDGKSTVNWTLWGSLPGFLDSANLNFSDKYSTVRAPRQAPRFPLRDSAGQVFFLIRPKHAGKEVEAEDTTLDAVTQGMGPSVYAYYAKDSLKFDENERDSVAITFLPMVGDPSVAMDWGAEPSRPSPKLYMNDKLVQDTAVLKWRWADGKKGFLIYQLPSVIGAATRLRVDLNGEPYRGKPIWMRNPKDEKGLPK